MNINKEPPIDEKAQWMNWWCSKNKETDLFKAHIAWGNRYEELRRESGSKPPLTTPTEPT